MSALDDILQRLEPSLGARSGDVIPLQGGITNHNFRVTFGDRSYVVRRHGGDTELLGIDRESERLAGETAARLGIAPVVAAAFDDCLATAYVAGSPGSARWIAARVAEIARGLRAFHDSGLVLPSTFSVPQLLDGYEAIIRSRGGTPPPAYTEVAAIAARIAEALPPQPARPCHNDLLGGNIIRPRDGGRVMIVDWEYAGMGDPRFDLGNLSVNNDFDGATDERLLHAYYGERPDDARRAALKLMRALSDAREAAWGVLQSEISELAFDFDAYGREHFERLRTTATQPPFEEWLAAAGS
ncbi:MAG: hypothetical protein QOI03_609 [Solirubrobacteraceae bacterium]|jgi:thiamine kinase-like enzyme|nr:hypothetical protein [Solirubrobacteraceae bacterium]